MVVTLTTTPWLLGCEWKRAEAGSLELDGWVLEQTITRPTCLTKPRTILALTGIELGRVSRSLQVAYLPSPNNPTISPDRADACPDHGPRIGSTN